MVKNTMMASTSSNIPMDDIKCQFVSQLRKSKKFKFPPGRPTKEQYLRKYQELMSPVVRLIKFPCELLRGTGKFGGTPTTFAIGERGYQNAVDDSEKEDLNYVASGGASCDVDCLSDSDSVQLVPDIVDGAKNFNEDLQANHSIEGDPSDNVENLNEKVSPLASVRPNSSRTRTSSNGTLKKTGRNRHQIQYHGLSKRLGYGKSFMKKLRDMYNFNSKPQKKSVNTLTAKNQNVDQSLLKTVTIDQHPEAIESKALNLIEKSAVQKICETMVHSKNNSYEARESAERTMEPLQEHSRNVIEGSTHNGNSEEGEDALKKLTVIRINQHSENICAKNIEDSLSTEVVAPLLDECAHCDHNKLVRNSEQNQSLEKDIDNEHATSDEGLVNNIGNQSLEKDDECFQDRMESNNQSTIPTCTEHLPERDEECVHNRVEAVAEEEAHDVANQLTEKCVTETHLANPCQNHKVQCDQNHSQTTMKTAITTELSEKVTQNHIDLDLKHDVGKYNNTIKSVEQNIATSTSCEKVISGSIHQRPIELDLDEDLDEKSVCGNSGVFSDVLKGDDDNTCQSDHLLEPSPDLSGASFPFNEPEDSQSDKTESDRIRDTYHGDTKDVLAKCPETTTTPKETDVLLPVVQMNKPGEKMHFSDLLSDEDHSNTDHDLQIDENIEDAVKCEEITEQDAVNGEGISCVDSESSVSPSSNTDPKKFKRGKRARKFKLSMPPKRRSKNLKCRSKIRGAIPKLRLVATSSSIEGVADNSPKSFMVKSVPLQNQCETKRKRKVKVNSKLEVQKNGTPTLTTDSAPAETDAINSGKPTKKRRKRSSRSSDDALPAMGSDEECRVTDDRLSMEFSKHNWFLEKYKTVLGSKDFLSGDDRNKKASRPKPNSQSQSFPEKETDCGVSSIISDHGPTIKEKTNDISTADRIENIKEKDDATGDLKILEVISLADYIEKDDKKAANEKTEPTLVSDTDVEDVMLENLTSAPENDSLQHDTHTVAMVQNVSQLESEFSDESSPLDLTKKVQPELPLDLSVRNQESTSVQFQDVINDADVQILEHNTPEHIVKKPFCQEIPSTEKKLLDRSPCPVSIPQASTACIPTRPTENHTSRTILVKSNIPMMQNKSPVNTCTSPQDTNLRPPVLVSFSDQNRTNVGKVFAPNSSGAMSAQALRDQCANYPEPSHRQNGSFASLPKPLTSKPQSFEEFKMSGFVPKPSPNSLAQFNVARHQSHIAYPPHQSKAPPLHPTVGRPPLLPNGVRGPVVTSTVPRANFTQNLHNTRPSTQKHCPVHHRHSTASMVPQGNRMALPLYATQRVPEPQLVGPPKTLQTTSQSRFSMVNHAVNMAPVVVPKVPQHVQPNPGFARSEVPVGAVATKTLNPSHRHFQGRMPATHVQSNRHTSAVGTNVRLLHSEPPVRRFPSPSNVSLTPQINNFPSGLNNIVVGHKPQAISPSDATSSAKASPPVTVGVGFITCGACTKRALFLCSGCKRVAYCSQACQVNSWKSHKNRCLR